MNNMSTLKQWKFDKTKLVTTREVLNLTQREVAERMGITKQMYQQWEAGTRTPNLNSLTKICDVLSVKPHIFFKENVIQSETQGV